MTSENEYGIEIVLPKVRAVDAESIRRLFLIGLATLVGAFFGISCIAEGILRAMHGYDHGHELEEIMIYTTPITAGIAGMLTIAFFNWKKPES